MTLTEFDRATDEELTPSVGLDEVEIHQRPVPDLNPGPVRLEGGPDGFFFNLNSLDVVGPGRGVGDNDGAEEEQDAGHGDRKEEEGDRDPHQADPAAPHGGDLAVAGEDPERQERGHEDGQRGDLEEDSRRSQREVFGQREELDVVPEEPADFLEKIHDQVNGHESGQAHPEDLDLFAQHVSEEYRHGRYWRFMRMNRITVTAKNSAFGSQAPAKGGSTNVVTKNSHSTLST